jgi:hypothetical protein
MYMTHVWKEAVPSVGPDLQFSIWWVLWNFGPGFQTLLPEMWTLVRVSFDKSEGCQGISCVAGHQILCHIMSPSLACSCHFSNWTFPCLTHTPAPTPPLVVPLIFQESPSHFKQPRSRGKLLHMGRNSEVPVSIMLDLLVWSCGSQRASQFGFMKHINCCNCDLWVGMWVGLKV